MQFYLFAFKNVWRSYETFLRKRWCFVSVVMQDFSVGATGSSVTRGNMAVLRCIVPSFVRDFLSVTSWLQDQKFNIYPSSDGGKHYFKYYFVRNRPESVGINSSAEYTGKHKSTTCAILVPRHIEMFVTERKSVFKRSNTLAVRQQDKAS
jgi:hypothetical protein